MYTQKQKEIVSLIRSIMRLDDRFVVFNNIYRSGQRTVKCYRDPKDPDKDLKLKSVIDETLTKLGVNVKFKFTEDVGSTWSLGPGGFIVKLPKGV